MSCEAVVWLRQDSSFTSGGIVVDFNFLVGIGPVIAPQYRPILIFLVAPGVELLAAYWRTLIFLVGVRCPILVDFLVCSCVKTMISLGWRAREVWLRIRFLCWRHVCVVLLPINRKAYLLSLCMSCIHGSL